jgi:gas vesicle protein
MIGAQKALGLARSFEIDDVLGAVGLQRRRNTLDRLLPALGFFGAGAAAGAVCALLMAPNSGAETRARLGNRIQNAKEQLDEGLRHTQERLQEATRSVEARIEHRHNGGTT